VVLRFRCGSLDKFHGSTSLCSTRGREILIPKLGAFRKITFIRGEYFQTGITRGRYIEGEET
jgi:hypothetical protein